MSKSLIIRASLTELTNVEWDVEIADGVCTAQYINKSNDTAVFSHTETEPADATDTKEFIGRVFQAYTKWISENMESQIQRLEVYLASFPPAKRRQALKWWSRRGKKSNRPRKPKPIRA